MPAVPIVPQALDDLWRGPIDRLIRAPWFVRWATRFPLTRPIARRRARDLFDLTAGFVYSQILSACVELRLFEHIADQPKTADQLALLMGLDRKACETLVHAACVLDLASRRAGGRYGLGRLGAALVANPGVEAMIRHHALFYRDLGDPVGLLKDADTPTALSGYWAYATAGERKALGEDRVGEYSALMAASQSFVAGEVLDAYPLSRHRCLLDLGGGEGAFVCAAAARAPQLTFKLFDLPAVAARAEKRFAAEGLSGRATAHGGDFLTDSLPQGADIVSLVRVIHDHEDANAMAILAAARRCLPPDGTLLLAEPMSDTPGAERMGDAYFAFYLLAMKSGRPRSSGQLRSMLSAAGFGRIRVLSTASRLAGRVLVAGVN